MRRCHRGNLEISRAAVPPNLATCMALKIILAHDLISVDYKVCIFFSAGLVQDFHARLPAGLVQDFPLVSFKTMRTVLHSENECNEQ